MRWPLQTGGAASAKVAVAGSFALASSISVRFRRGVNWNWRGRALKETKAECARDKSQHNQGAGTCGAWTSYADHHELL